MRVLLKDHGLTQKDTQRWPLRKATALGALDIWPPGPGSDNQDSVELILPPLVSSSEAPMNARLVSVTHEPNFAAKKNALLATLCGLLRTSFELRHEGASYEKQARAQGYADGFMRSLLDGGLVSQRELLEFVQGVRRGVDGPATVALAQDEPESNATATVRVA